MAEPNESGPIGLDRKMIEGGRMTKVIEINEGELASIIAMLSVYLAELTPSPDSGKVITVPERAAVNLRDLAIELAWDVAPGSDKDIELSYIIDTLNSALSDQKE
jgi:hypothetical protein